MNQPSEPAAILLPHTPHKILDAGEVLRELTVAAGGAHHHVAGGGGGGANGIITGGAVGRGGAVGLSDVGAAPPQHLVRLCQLATVGGGASVAFWAARYLSERVVGSSPNTFQAKSRDLGAFAAWFVRINGEGAGIGSWRRRDTQIYLRHLEGAGRAPSSINRALATLRHFARWVHDEPGAVFGHMGLPTVGVRDIVTDEPPCKKLLGPEIHQLFKAADDRVVLKDSGRLHHKTRPRRDRAILAVLRFAGLRVSELVMLRREQYRGNHLVEVARKGRARTRQLYLVAECREHLDEYLALERALDDPEGKVVPLFFAQRSHGYLTRHDVAHMLKRLAALASVDLPSPMHVHPHALRHSFGAEHRERSGSDSETAAALGHTGIQYVGRYARRSDKERQALMEAVFEPRERRERK